MFIRNQSILSAGGGLRNRFLFGSSSYVLRFAARVRAAFRAAVFKTAEPLVLAAFLAEALLCAAVRLRADFFACLDKAFLDAASRPSRFNALDAARDLFAETFLEFFAFFKSRFACFRVLSLVFPLSGGGNFTPARRALDRPIAIACRVFRAPCFPSRICSISSRTNSPAWVVGAFPSSSAYFAFSIVSFSGDIMTSHSRDSSKQFSRFQSICHRTPTLVQLPKREVSYVVWNLLEPPVIHVPVSSFRI
jgi:hypothetical protein